MAFDSGTDLSGYGSTLTVSHTVGAGSDRHLFVVLSYSSSADKVTGVTYAGVSMTRKTYQNNGAKGVAVYELDAPTTGANNVVVSTTGGAATYAGAALSVDGKSAATTAGTMLNGFVSSPLSQSISANAGDLIIDYASATSDTANAFTVGGGQTLIFSAAGPVITSQKVAASTGSATMSESWSGGAQKSIQGAVLVVPQPTASGPTINTQPTAQTANEGATATFTVSATGTGTLSYAWERQAPGGGSFSAVGTNSSSYTTAALDCATDHLANFRVTATDDNGPTVSSTVALTVRSVNTTSRPGSDVTTTGWTASAGTDFFALMDEASAIDVDYATSPTVTGSTAPITLGLVYPLNTGTWTGNVRAKTSTGTATLRVYLLDGTNTVVGTSADQTITSTYTNYPLSIVISGPATRARIEVVT